MKLVALITPAVVFLLIGRAYCADPPGTTPARVSIEQIATGELIDRLVDITNDEFSVRTNIFAGNALPPGLLNMQAPALAPSQAMSELRRRGVSAMPQLLAHLDDARSTKSTITGMFSGIEYSAEFDRNPRTSKNVPKGVRTMGLDNTPIKVAGQSNRSQYAVTVGDLCFNLIGDIVNRNYQAVRYQPTALVIVNSPVLCTDLRDAVRAEWSGLTPEQHRNSLIADATRPDTYGRDQGGINALWDYYPDATVDVIKIRLSGPRYDSMLIATFAQNGLYQTTDAQERKKLIDQFSSQHGPAYRDGLLDRLWADRDLNQSTSLPWLPKILVEPKLILAEMLPGHDPQLKPETNAEAIGGMNSFIDSLRGIHNDAIDKIIWDDFAQLSVIHSSQQKPEEFEADSCVTFLVHRGHDAELAAYCRRRCDELIDPYAKAKKAAMLSLIEGRQP